MKDVQKMREWLRSVGADPNTLDEKGCYGGSLYLANNNLSKVTFPEGMTIGGSLDLANNNLSKVTFPGGMTIGGSLGLANNNLSKVTFPEGMTIGGSLYLANNNLSKVTFPEGMTIGGYLYLANNNLSKVTFPEGMTIGGYLDLGNNNLSEVTFPEGMTIGGSLYLANNNLSKVTFPEGMTIGGYLDLANNNLSKVTFPGGMTIGGSLGLANNNLSKVVTPPPTKPAPSALHWEWRGRRFIKADGIFQEVVSQRGNVYRVKNIGSKDVTYLVTDGNDRWSHGKTLKEAKEDLIYKISNRDTSRYESLTLDDVLTRAEAIECYRVITGACAQGTKAFVTSLPKVKDEYTIREIITLTEGQYGGQTFKDYFNK